MSADLGSHAHIMSADCGIIGRDYIPISGGSSGSGGSSSSSSRASSNTHHNYSNTHHTTTTATHATTTATTEHKPQLQLQLLLLLLLHASRSTSVNTCINLVSLAHANPMMRHIAWVNVGLSGMCVTDDRNFIFENALGCSEASYFLWITPGPSTTGRRVWFAV